VSFAVDRDRAENRRRRITRRAHACHRGKKTWTVIRHAHNLGLANATPAVALAVAMIEPTLLRLLVSSSRLSLRNRPRHDFARRSAEPLPAVARSADPEHDLAQRTSLEAKLVVIVHRLLAR
jgi:hypothetical protein